MWSNDRVGSDFPECIESREAHHTQPVGMQLAMRPRSARTAGDAAGLLCFASLPAMLPRRQTRHPNVLFLHVLSRARCSDTRCTRNTAFAWGHVESHQRYSRACTRAWQLAAGRPRPEQVCRNPPWVREPPPPAKIERRFDRKCTRPTSHTRSTCSSGGDRTEICHGLQTTPTTEEGASSL